MLDIVEGRLVPVMTTYLEASLKVNPVISPYGSTYAYPQVKLWQTAGSPFTETIS
jgi:hypothetical protein